MEGQYRIVPSDRNAHDPVEFRRVEGVARLTVGKEIHIPVDYDLVFIQVEVGMGREILIWEGVSPPGGVLTCLNPHRHKGVGVGRLQIAAIEMGIALVLQAPIEPTEDTGGCKKWASLDRLNKVNWPFCRSCTGLPAQANTCSMLLPRNVC